MRRTTRQFALLALLSFALAPARAAAPAALEPFPEEEVRPGLRGVVSTVLHGTAPEPLEVEILGVLDDGIGPGVDMILGRLLGEKANWSGVAAGMSGSPVIVDGKILGALSYSIGVMQKEPICGITPIRRMLALHEYPGGTLPWVTADPQSTWRPIPLAVSARGVAAGLLERYTDIWDAIGALPRGNVMPATAGDVDAGPEALVPGAPVAALLVWGDVQLGATGTVTWRDGDQLLAFGHPFLGIGRTRLPMAPAEIIWTVPSLIDSFKIARIGKPVGTVDQDRMTAIAGQLGAVPPGIPVAITVRRSGRPESKFQYYVARDPFLSPLLADLVLRITIGQAIGAERDEALRMNAKIELEDGASLALRLSAPGGPQGSTDQVLGLELSRNLAALARPPFPLPEVSAVDVELSSVEPDGAWAVKRAMPDRLVAWPGDTVRVFVDLTGPRGMKRRETLAVKVPQDAPAGTYALLAGSARGLAGEFGSQGEARRRTARDAADYLAALAESPPDDRLQATLARPAEGLVGQGREYPALPGSAHILLRSRPGGTELYRTKYLPLASAYTDMGRTVVATARVSLEVRSRESAR
ncbi:MAG: hypothetical protein KBD01_16055 [Acidobacteria bacterium]|nr:hypothetical protein [Acidobacteriota bacterium]